MHKQASPFLCFRFLFANARVAPDARGAELGYYSPDHWKGPEHPGLETAVDRVGIQSYFQLLSGTYLYVHPMMLEKSWAQV